MSAPATDRVEIAGLLAEFETAPAVVAAARTVRDAGYRRWDVHSPFPIHGIDEAMGLRPTMLPWIVLASGVAGTVTGLLLAWWTNAIDYPYFVSGKPLFSLPAFMPVIFETTVLAAAFGAVLGMFGLNLLPMLYNPLFRHERFRRVTNDRFFIVIDASDPSFDLAATRGLLESCGATAVEEVEE